MIAELLDWWRSFRGALRLADVIDILIIAAFIHFALLWIRRRASRAVVVGLGLIVLLHVAARQLDMVLTPWLFQVGFTALAIGLVLVFQNDIRRAFEQFAAQLGIIRRRREVYADVAGLLAGALGVLARERVGALVVLPGRQPIDQHVSGGVPLDGKLSAPLLESLFDPSSNGHDGALIVARDRVHSFSVHLPLSENHEALGDHGTRHAAGLGLSERTDALALIVSEEHGRCSVAEGGELEAMADEAALRARIEAFAEPEDDGSGSSHGRLRRSLAWARDATLHQWPNKLLALGMALLLWLLVAFQVEPLVRQFSVPVQFTGLPQDLMIEDVYPEAITLTLSGPQHRFGLMDMERLHVSVDLAELETGYHLVPFSAEDVDLPGGRMTVSDFSPDGVSFTLRRVEATDADEP